MGVDAEKAGQYVLSSAKTRCYTRKSCDKSINCAAEKMKKIIPNILIKKMLEKNKKTIDKTVCIVL